MRGTLEQLEDRILLSFSPTAYEQEMLEHINRMRMNPQAELNVLFSSINPLVARDPYAQSAIQYFGDPTSAEIQAEWPVLQPVQPLAWNESLYNAARAHSNLMIQYDTQSHQLPGEPELGTRLANAGYAGMSAAGENIYAFTESVFHGHSAFAIDYGVPSRGHRTNMMDLTEYEGQVLTFREIGIGIIPESNPGTEVGPLVVTEDFGNRWSFGNSWLLGVAYKDNNANGRYDGGEGLGGVSIQAVGPGGTFTVQTMTAGGYQVQVPAGTYTVTASGGGMASPQVRNNVAIGAANVKVDFEGSVVTTDVLLADFGAAGTWWRNGAQWTFVHSQSPTVMAAGDFDGNGQADAVLDFGAGKGIWIFSNGSTWQKLHGKAAKSMAAGDLDGDGKDEVVIDFTNSGGIWRYSKATGLWTLLHNGTGDSLLCVDWGDGSRDMLSVDFGAGGVWEWRDFNSTWRHLLSQNPVSMTAGNLDGAAPPDMLFDLGPGKGIWIYAQEAHGTPPVLSSYWAFVHPSTCDGMVTGDINGDGADEVMVDFGAAGTWAWDTGPLTWTRLHTKSPERMVCGDLDGGGRDDVIMDFGASGLWMWKNNSSFQLLHGANPELVAVARVSGSTKLESAAASSAASEALVGILGRVSDSALADLYPAESDEKFSGHLGLDDVQSALAKAYQRRGLRS